jgi:cobalamin synthase
VNTKNGKINGQSLREGGGGGDFAIPGFILLITLSVQAGICGITMLYLGIFKYQGIYRKHQPNHQPWPFLLFVCSLFLHFLPKNLSKLILNKLQIAGISGFVAACAGTAFAIKESNGTPDSSRATITYSPIRISFLWFGMASTFAAAFSEQRERLIESISGDTFGGSCEAGWKERLGFWKLKWKKG